MGKQAENKERNRGAIVAAAVQVFADKGKDSATIADVVQVSGLARGTFYNYYPTLEAVWEDVLVGFFSQVADEVHKARSKADSLEAFVRNGYQAYFSLLASNPVFVQLIVRNSHAVRQTFLQAPTSMSMYRQLEADMKASGFFAAYGEDEIRIQCVAMIGAVFELLSHSVAPGKTPNATVLTNTLTRMFVHGLKG